MEVGGALGGIFAGKFKQQLNDFLLVNYLPRIICVSVCMCVSLSLFIYIHLYLSIDIST